MEQLTQILQDATTSIGEEYFSCRFMAAIPFTGARLLL